MAELRKKQATLGRYVTPEDVAYAALFLATDESSVITGRTICCDGSCEIENSWKVIRKNP